MNGAPNTPWSKRNPKKTVFCMLITFFLLCDLIAGFLLIPDIEGEYHHYYHHALKKNYHGSLAWGALSYPIYTNSLGFKDSRIREVELTDDRYRILIIGDSFGEGLGYPHDKTFAGIVENKVDQSTFDVLNASVKSYSPKFYYLKTKYLIEEIGFRFNELYVFIDISDISDEVFWEFFKPTGRHSNTSILRNTDNLFKRLSYTYYRIGGKLLRKLYGKYKLSASRGMSLNRNNKKMELSDLNAKGDPYIRVVSVKKQTGEESYIGMDVFLKRYYEDRAKWTIDRSLYEAWGKKGLALAEENMIRLVSLCENYNIRLTIAVYPWPLQIEKRDLNSIQVKFWKSFAIKYNVGFINFFPDFINNIDPNTIKNSYFIPGDDHWNDKGHELIAFRLLNRINENGS